MKNSPNLTDAQKQMIRRHERENTVPHEGAQRERDRLPQNSHDDGREKLLDLHSHQKHDRDHVGPEAAEAVHKRPQFVKLHRKDQHREEGEGDHGSRRVGDNALHETDGEENDAANRAPSRPPHVQKKRAADRR